MYLNLVEQALALPPRVEHTEGRRAAVVMAFVPGDRVLFIQRGSWDGDPWSGHVAFPGGKADDTDPNLRFTASREFMEEIGSPLDDGRWLGRLHDLRARPVRDMVIRPFVVQLPERPVLQQQGEVARSFTIPFSHLLEGRGRGSMAYSWQGTEISLPCVRLGDTVLWGLSLRIVDDLLDRIDNRGQGLNRPTSSDPVDVEG